MAKEKAEASQAKARSATRVLIALTVLGALVFVASIGVVIYVATWEDEGEVAESSFLDVELDGVLGEDPGAPPLFAKPDELPIVVAELSQAIRAAGTDDRIDGLTLRFGDVAASWAVYQELRDAVVDFRASGKPCVAYAASGYANGSYYLASACGPVMVHPGGTLLVNGLSMQVTYLKGTLDKLGIVSDFEHVGDFKSATETFEREGPSEAAAEAYEALVGDLYDQMVAGIAESRGQDPETIRAWIDTPTMAPELALQRGMIDGQAFPDIFYANAWKASEEGGLADLSPDTEASEEELEDADDHYTSIREYVKARRATLSDIDDQVAVIVARGEIRSGGNDDLFDDGNLTDGEFSRWMREARDDEDVKAVVIRVDSPGGSVLPSTSMRREVARTRAAGKPVVISMSGLAASGGYLLSCDADWIIAQPGTLTGSIGVFGGKLALAGAYEKLGVTTHAFERGALANLFSGTEPFSDEGRAVFRSYLEHFYEQFLGMVAEGRHMDRDAVHAVAQGRVWTGHQAIERGLVDQLGGLDDAIAKAAELADLQAADVGWHMVPAQKSFFELFLEDLESSSQAIAPTVALPEPLDAEALHTLESAAAILEEGPAAWWPGAPLVR